MSKTDAYKIVLNDFLEKGSIFTGNYDARCGNEHFMCGISTVMESIAYSIDEEAGDFVSDLFVKNMVNSKLEAEKWRKENEIFGI